MPAGAGPAWGELRVSGRLCCRSANVREMAELSKATWGCRKSRGWTRSRCASRSHGTQAWRPESTTLGPSCAWLNSHGAPELVPS